MIINKLQESSAHSKNLENDNTNNEIEAPKRRYISPEERQQIIDELRLVWKYNNGISKHSKCLDNTSNQPSKFKTNNWVEIIDGSRAN